MFLFFVFLAVVVNGQPAGWKMTDRFHGFRYEFQSNTKNTEEFLQSFVDQADSLGCFGWIQHPIENLYVGEIRCNKVKGPEYSDWIKSNNVVKNANIKVCNCECSVICD